MPPPAVHPDAAQADAPPSLEDASARLESALARLEALVDAGPLQSELFRARTGEAPADGGEASQAGALRPELDATRERERALEAAAAAASQALAHAMAEVRRALDAGGDGAEEDDEAEPDLPLDLEPVEAEDEPR